MSFMYQLTVHQDEIASGKTIYHWLVTGWAIDKENGGLVQEI